MSKFVFILISVMICHAFGDMKDVTEKTVSESGRQKRLLFYDEEGNLVKTYSNPYMRDFVLSPEKAPVLGSYLNPFLNFLRPPSFAPTYYVIPVSSAVVQDISSNPTLQNKLVLAPRHEGIQANPLCEGKRNQQLPSPHDCSSFLNCWDGFAFEQECPDGLLFAKEGYCDYPANVECHDRRMKFEIAPTCIKDLEAFRNEVHCGEFFVCIGHQPIKFKCPADLAYNQVLGICDYPDRVKCNAAYALATEAPSTAAAAASTEKQADTLPVVVDAKETKPPAPQLPANFAFNTQSWSSTHVAISRQDAVRQLELRRLANVKTNF